MEKLELYVISENGQLVINWESLELLTNKKVVEDVKKFTKGSAIFSILFEESKYIINIVIRFGIHLLVINYHKESISGINHYDLCILPTDLVKEVIL